MGIIHLDLRKDYVCWHCKDIKIGQLYCYKWPIYYCYVIK